MHSSQLPVTFIDIKLTNDLRKLKLSLSIFFFFLVVYVCLLFCFVFFCFVSIFLLSSIPTQFVHLNSLIVVVLISYEVIVAPN